jgi:hypothetical protein
LYSEPMRVVVEPAALYARVPHEFKSRTDEINGSTQVAPGSQDAIVHYLDLPMLGTLLFSNTRTGRPIDPHVSGIQVLGPQPPPVDARSFGELGSDVVMDRYGSFYEKLHSFGGASLASDGSLRVRLPGGVPLTFALTGDGGKILSFPSGAPFSGPMRQREATQFYPGERVKQGMGRQLFNGVCAGCHGSISGRELDIGISVDVLTSASRTLESDHLHELQ